ncbi:Mis12 domain-containing protein [Phyllosticta citriasiana]|uniref:Mis12 domain-containing protein n=1 Tax=Phyllosticta citriasiana TaxID=595635 RepID=A0ABR1KLQ2_9PEZI
MASATQIETALLTEHFRYTPLTLIDQIINMINELLQHAVDAVESGLLNTSPENLGFAAGAAAQHAIPDTDGEGRALYPEMRREIEEGVHMLETLLEANVDRNFDKLEIWALRNVFKVEEGLVPWVRLGHYENVQVPGSAAENQPTPESVQALRQKVLETSKLQTALVVEKKRNEALISQLRGLLGAPTTMAMKRELTASPPRGASAGDNGARSSASRERGEGQAAASLGFLATAPAARALGVNSPLTAASEGAAGGRKNEPLKTNTAFTLSQLPALRSLLEALRPKVAGLGPSATGSDLSQERRDYIENQTRRLLERRGVDVKNGEGSVEGMGRRVAPDEVRGMEAVAGLLEKGGGE